MILTESDRATFFPSSELTGTALIGAVLAAQAMAETAAGRPLEITQFTETIELQGDYPVTLKYHPIVHSLPIVVEGSDFHCGWRPLAATEYQITPDGEFCMRRGGCSKARISYSAGFDFSQESPEIFSIKAMVATILRYQMNS